MKVTLIEWTGSGHQDFWHAADLMIFTKNTRVKMGPDGLEQIRAWDRKKKMAELEYMANTIRASWEFVDYTFMMEGVTRAFTHQLVRHRHGSYAQQTMQILDVRDAKVERPTFTSEDLQAVWDDAVGWTMGAYSTLIDAGASVEKARGLLPTNIHTNIVAKFTLRSVVDIIHARVSPRNLGEFRDVAVAMREKVLEVHPWAAVFLEQTRDKVLEDMDAELLDLRATEPERATRLLKLVDQVRRS